MWLRYPEHPQQAWFYRTCDSTWQSESDWEGLRRVFPADALLHLILPAAWFRIGSLQLPLMRRNECLHALRLMLSTQQTEEVTTRLHAYTHAPIYAVGTRTWYAVAVHEEKLQACQQQLKQAFPRDTTHCPIVACFAEQTLAKKLLPTRQYRDCWSRYWVHTGEQWSVWEEEEWHSLPTCAKKAEDLPLPVQNWDEKALGNTLQELDAQSPENLLHSWPDMVHAPSAWNITPIVLRMLKWAVYTTLLTGISAAFSVGMTQWAQWQSHHAIHRVQSLQARHAWWEHWSTWAAILKNYPGIEILRVEKTGTQWTVTHRIGNRTIDTQAYIRALDKLATVRRTSSEASAAPEQLVLTIDWHALPILPGKA